MKNLLLLLFLSCSLITYSQNKTEYKTIKDISYVDQSEQDTYRKERCKLDIYYPTNKKSFATVIWFHGGGLEGGEKHIPEGLQKQGFAVIGVNYRLSPKAKNPAYIEDAAASVAWAFQHIASYGGDPSQIFLAGHSAGGYLVLMVGLDKSYLQKHGIDADSIKGLLPISGQTNTHYTIRKERGIPMEIPLVDSFSPLNQSRKGIPPTLLITGDRKLEMTARYEENLHLEAILKSLGNTNVTLYEIEGFDHNTVYTPGCYLIQEWIKKNSNDHKGK